MSPSASQRSQHLVPAAPCPGRDALPAGILLPHGHSRAGKARAHRGPPPLALRETRTQRRLTHREGHPRDRAVAGVSGRGRGREPGSRG